MAEWFLWIKDRRRDPLPRADLKLRIEASLRAQGVDLIEEPAVVLPPERHRGEWCLRVSYVDRMTPVHEAVRVLDRSNIGVLVCQQAPRRMPPLRSVPT